MKDLDSFDGAGGAAGATAGQEDNRVKDFLEVISHRKNRIALIGALAIFCSLLYHVLFPSYTARSYLLMESEEESSGFQALLTTLDVKRDSPIITESEIEKALLVLKSPDFLRRWASTLAAAPDFAAFETQLKFSKALPEPVRIQALAKRVAGMVRVIGKMRGVVEVSISSPKRELSVFLANTYLDAAVKFFSDREERKLNVARDYIKTKIEETIRKMEGTDQEIVSISTKNANVSLLAGQKVVSEKLLQLKTDIQTHVFRLEQNEKLITSLSAKVASEGNANRDPLEAIGSGAYGLQKTIRNLESENEVLRVRIESMKKGLQGLLKSNLSLPKEEQALSDLQRQKGLDFFVFDNLFKTHLQLEVKGLSLLNRIYPLQKVNIADTFVSFGLLPKTLLALLFSTICSALGMFAYHVFSPVIRTKRDLEPTSLFHLGNIPTIDQLYFQQAAARQNLCRFEVESKETVAFKHVRSRLLHLMAHSGGQRRNVIAIQSYGNGEGKSFVSTNLSACFGYMGKKTLLIDFDIRKASISKSFGHEHAPGVCALLDNNATLDSLIVKSVAPGLDLLPAGILSANATEMVTNQKFSALLNELRPLYDVIVIDTAPLLVAHESVVVAKEADLAILMVTSWKTKMEYVTEALDEIKNVRRSAVHYILNRVQETNMALVSNYYYMGSLARRQATVEITQ